VAVAFTVRAGAGQTARWRLELDADELNCLGPLDVKEIAGIARDGERVEAAVTIPPDSWGTLGIEAHTYNGGEDWDEFARAEVVLEMPANLHFAE